MAKTKTKEELNNEAKALGITLTGKETNAEIQQAIDIKTEENAQNGGGATQNNDAVTTPAKGKKTVYFYHVKVKAFKNDSERVDVGLYKTNELVERFEKMSDDYVERYDNEVPLLDLHKIAEKYRVNVYQDGGKKARSEEEILEELAKVL